MKHSSAGAPGRIRTSDPSSRSIRASPTSLRKISRGSPRKYSGVPTELGHHHFIDLSLVADVEGQKVRLSANAAVAVTMEEH